MYHNQFQTVRQCFRIIRAATINRYKLDKPYGWLLFLAAVFDPYLFAAIAYFVLRTVFQFDGPERYPLLLIGFISFRWLVATLTGATNFAGIRTRMAETTTKPTTMALAVAMGPPAVVFISAHFVAVISIALLQPQASFAGIKWLPFVIFIQATWTAVFVLGLSRFDVLDRQNRDLPIAAVAALLWFTSPVMFTFRDIPAGASKFLTSYNPVSHLLAAMHNAVWFGRSVSLEVLPFIGVLGLALLFVLHRLYASKESKTVADAARYVPNLIEKMGREYPLRIFIIDSAFFVSDRLGATANKIGHFHQWRRGIVGLTGQDLVRLVVSVWGRENTDAEMEKIKSNSGVDHLFADPLSVYPDWALDQLSIMTAVKSPLPDIFCYCQPDRNSSEFFNGIWPLIKAELDKGRRITLICDRIPDLPPEPPQAAIYIQDGKTFTIFTPPAD